jgi:hypothetical protein
MAEFADRMKSFTNHLRTSISMRTDALAQVRSETEDLRDRARSFMNHVADEHRTRAEELRATLVTHREECRQNVAELRENNQEALRKIRSDLQHVFSETRQARQETANQLRLSFQHARNELALDLGEASLAWREFTAGRDEPPTPPAPAPTKKPRPSSTHNGDHAIHAAAAKQEEPVASFVSAKAKRSDDKPTKGGKHRAQAHHGR